ncbi:MAG: UDP-glucose/GDP-mannose dehydrogenase family protein [Rickettsiales bacterium]|nr:UDP-glucose/GDP-mannose dehydrogenase family protein [Rickettsiales bacterium]
MLRILVIGTGYVGLVSGTCFAEIGHHVTCIDKDKVKIDGLISGAKVPIYEKGLNELIENNKKNGRLHFDTDISKHLNHSDVVIIAVGTPLDDKGQTNFEYIDQCVSEIIQYAQKGLYVIIKSTVPVGTCDRIQMQFNIESNVALEVISNPEFLREGEAVNDFLFPDRVIIGVNIQDNHIINKLYKKLEQNGVEIVYTNRLTAELIKYASNSFLAAKVAFINEIADLSEELGADIAGIAHGVGLDRRIGRAFLNAGPGFGGSCFPKDIKALINISESRNLNLPLLKSIDLSNQIRYQNIARKIETKLESGATIAVLGLTYKAGTDDTRCSPSIKIIQILSEKGFKIKGHDPQGINKAKQDLGNNIIFCHDLYEAAKDADLCLVMTEWSEYRDLDSLKLAACMRKKNIYDLRQVINKDDFIKSGFKVMVVGYQSE